MPADFSFFVPKRNFPLFFPLSDFTGKHTRGVGRGTCGGASEARTPAYISPPRVEDLLSVESLSIHDYN